MNIDKWFSTITWAALAGLVVLNYRGASELFGTIGGQIVNYVRTVQGR